MAALFADDPGSSPVARRAAQPVWRDPASGYLRRAVSPAGFGMRATITEVTIPPGACVRFDALGLGDVDQQVWILEGALEVEVGGMGHRLEAGDCLAMRLDRPVRFANAATQPVRYAVVNGGWAS